MSEILKNQDESVDSNNQWDTLSDEKSWDDHAKEVSNIEESSEGPVSVPKPEGTIPSPKRPDSESGAPVPKPEFTDLGTGYEGTGYEELQSSKKEYNPVQDDLEAQKRADEKAKTTQDTINTLEDLGIN
jgi:hypothetical protein